MKKIQSLTGMMDLIENKANKADTANGIFYTEHILKDIFETYSISEIRTPALEDSSLFKRSVGDTSDIVNKELYSFMDKNDKSITLRPEGTASVIRSIIEKKIDNESNKFWYLGPMWRYERPQKGRYRQFSQAGVEILGYSEGIAELEIVSIICSINKALGIENSILKINHLGDKESKEKYCNALKNFLMPLSSKLDEKDIQRLNTNPLRVLDSKSSETQEILKDAPKINDFLTDQSLDLLNLVKNTFSEECNIKIDHTLVRGLDYYTGFVFEAVSTDLGAQDAYLGGGRYDDLCKQLGGKDLPAIGMAIGIERLSLLTKTYKKNRTLISFIIISSNLESKAYKIAHDLRSINSSIDIDVQLSDGSLKSKLRRANKDNASYAFIIGDDELKSENIIVKSLNDENSEQIIMNISEIENFIQNIK
ncbi:MAG: histidine--tRNA ligase [SAR86 cluster bacterium]|uniref:Histidine--tRNA ligase n=1 Tax=SAR86 cluster bacterium TaxID=2030880 RepID=A0A520N698_9GAMM|nr:MAG: histidine--tRNA ligase [SAR86 cluster bacterium]